MPKHITYKIYLENDDEDSHTRYSNLDGEFLKMHDPSMLNDDTENMNEDSEVLLESPKGRSPHTHSRISNQY